MGWLSEAARSSVGLSNVSVKALKGRNAAAVLKAEDILHGWANRTPGVEWLSSQRMAKVDTPLPTPEGPKTTYLWVWLDRGGTTTR